MTIDKNSKVGQFLSHVLPGVMRPLRVLWHEIIGFVFACLFMWAAPSLFRNVRDLSHGQGDIGRVLLSAFFTLLMAYFGVTSFLRARKISRS
jgi:hypothetical protein